MSTNALPAGWTVERQRTVWSRWDEYAMKTRISHPIMWLLTSPDGDMRYFDTRREAAAYAAENAESAA